MKKNLIILQKTVVLPALTLCTVAMHTPNMKHFLTPLVLLIALVSNAQYDKFRKAEAPVASHAFAPLGSVGYAYQGKHFLQLGLMYGTNYAHPKNSLKKKNFLRTDGHWDYNVLGLGLGTDIGWLSTGKVFAPKFFVEFETYQRTLFYRMNAIQYTVGDAKDLRIMPEFGVYLGKNNHIALMAGYSQPIKKEIKEISRLKIGLTVYPALVNGISYKVANEMKVDTQAFKPVPGIKEPEMVLVKGGTFRMGANMIQVKDKRVLRVTDVPEDEQPTHQVTLPDYYIGKHEVTYAEFREFIKQTGYVTQKDRVEKLNYGLIYQTGLIKNKNGACFWNGNEWEIRHLNLDNDAVGHKRTAAHDNDPVIYITVNDALKYCEWLSVQTGKKYRLPTEAEWEYAASGGNKSQGYIFPGGGSLDEVAWYKSNSKRSTHKVGTKKPNELGIYDMAGNVMEMCMDWYDATYYQWSKNDNPQGPEEYLNKSRNYSIRGSSWASTADDSRTTRRNFCEMGTASNCLGFRVVAEK